MDYFGIGNAIKATISMYRVASRQTGRTLMMVNSLKPGDRIIFTNHEEANRVKNLCHERGVSNIRFKVCDPCHPEMLFNQGTSQGRTIFDHTWIEEYYVQAIERIEREINSLQEQLSGYGEAHIKTKLAVKEYHRFMQYLPELEE